MIHCYGCARKCSCSNEYKLFQVDPLMCPEIHHHLWPVDYPLLMSGITRVMAFICAFRVVNKRIVFINLCTFHHEILDEKKWASVFRGAVVIILSIRSNKYMANFLHNRIGGLFPESRVTVIFTEEPLSVFREKLKFSLSDDAYIPEKRNPALTQNEFNILRYLHDGVSPGKIASKQRENTKTIYSQIRAIERKMNCKISRLSSRIH